MKNPRFLQKSICLSVIFILSQFLQAYTYSNERYSFQSVRTDFSTSLSFLKLDGNNLKTHTFNPDYFQLAYKNHFINPSSRIYSRGYLTPVQLSRFLVTHNNSMSFADAIDFTIKYIAFCRTEGINHDIAFAQMCLETGYLKFGGSVLPSQNNFCGLGAIHENCRGESFETIGIGILAHIQHLKAYASYEEIKTRIVDPRFRFVKRGSAETIWDLTGKWAVDPDYGKKIEKLLSHMYSI